MMQIESDWKIIGYRHGPDYDKLDLLLQKGGEYITATIPAIDLEAMIEMGVLVEIDQDARLWNQAFVRVSE